MDKAMIAAVTGLGLWLGLCATAQAGYRTEVKVTPYTAPHQFVVQFKIMQSGKDGKFKALSEPKLVVEADSERQIKDGRRERKERRVLQGTG